MRLEVDEHVDEGFNLTPLIDVVFLLLVFFLVATTFADEEVEMELELPEATSGEPSSSGHLIVVSVAQNGTMTVDGRSVTMDGLRDKLRAAATSNKDQEVLIRGDTRVQFGMVAKAFDACLAADLRRISIAAQPTEAQPR
ncbi:MAG: ExbD/TolR family protein [Planctomycetota bacterium]